MSNGSLCTNKLTTTLPQVVGLSNSRRKLHGNHRAAGPEYQLAVGNLEVELVVENSGGVWRPEFARMEEAEEHRCYWYIEDKGEYVVIKNLESGESYPMTGRSDWASVKMAGERVEEEFWEGPPRGSRRFVVRESGVNVE